MPIERHDVRGISKQGGTILGTSRTNPFEGDGGGPSGSQRVMDEQRHRRRSSRSAARARSRPPSGSPTPGINIVGVPKTIDNDLSATDYTFGFDTAVQIATDAMDRLRTTGDSHGRCMIAEVMGRHVGWIALHSGMAAGAHAILIPEQKTSIEQICEWVESARDRGRAPLVAVAEGFKLDTMDDAHSERGPRRVRPSATRRHRRPARARDRGAHRHRVPLDDAGPHPARRHPDRLRPRARHPLRHGRDRLGLEKHWGRMVAASRHPHRARPVRGGARQPQARAAGPLRRGRDPLRLTDAAPTGLRLLPPARARTAPPRCSSAARNTASARATTSDSAASSSPGSPRWKPRCARSPRSPASSSRPRISSREGCSAISSRTAKRGARSRTCSCAGAGSGAGAIRRARSRVVRDHGDSARRDVGRRAVLAARRARGRGRAAVLHVRSGSGVRRRSDGLISGAQGASIDSMHGSRRFRNSRPLNFW